MPVLSKVAAEFVVAEHLRPSILKKIGDNQFGRPVTEYECLVFHNALPAYYPHS